MRVGGCKRKGQGQQLSGPWKAGGRAEADLPNLSYLIANLQLHDDDDDDWGRMFGKDERQDDFGGR